MADYRASGLSLPYRPPDGNGRDAQPSPAGSVYTSTCPIANDRARRTQSNVERAAVEESVVLTKEPTAGRSNVDDAWSVTSTSPPSVLQVFVSTRRRPAVLSPATPGLALRTLDEGIGWTPGLSAAIARWATWTMWLASGDSRWRSVRYRRAMIGSTASRHDIESDELIGGCAGVGWCVPRTRWNTPQTPGMNRAAAINAAGQAPRSLGWEQSSTPLPNG